MPNQKYFKNRAKTKYPYFIEPTKEEALEVADFRGAIEWLKMFKRVKTEYLQWKDEFIQALDYCGLDRSRLHRSIIQELGKGINIPNEWIDLAIRSYENIENEKRNINREWKNAV